MKKILRKTLFAILSFPKTLFFNLRTFPFNLAIKFPVFVGYKVSVVETHKGIIEFDSKQKITHGMFVFGYGGSRGPIPNPRGELCLQKGKLILEGSAIFGQGSSLRLNGILRIGKNFRANQNTFISCTSPLSKIGDNALLGWNVSIRDSDGHMVFVDGKPKKSIRPFTIGNHVWICAEAHVLKGVTIGSNSIVAYRSTVSKSFPEEGSLVGGSPAELLQSNVNWGDYDPELEESLSRKETR